MAEYKAKLLKNGGGKNKIEYSTTEHVIGEWIDGSTLYEKTINCGALPSSTGSKTTNHEIPNLATVVEIEGFGKHSTSGNTIPIPRNSINALTENITIYVTPTAVVIGVGENQSVWNAYVTLRYTKTS